MSDWALITDGVVTNVIVCADGDDTFACTYVAQDTNDHDTAVCLDGMDPAPGIAWTQGADGTFSAPVPPPPDPAIEAAAQQRVADQTAVDTLLPKRGRTAAETQALVDALARLAGVEPGDG